MVPALRPGHGLLVRVPLVQPPFLHRLRRRSPGVVRQLRGYYAAVCLPTADHRGLTANGLPLAARPSADLPPPDPTGRGGIGTDGRPSGLPVLAHGDSAHAQVLRPRRVRRPLALPRPSMLPSARLYGVSTPNR